MLRMNKRNESKNGVGMLVGVAARRNKVDIQQKPFVKVRIVSI